MKVAKLRVMTYLLLGLLSLSNLQAREFDDPSLRHIKNPSWFINDPFFELNESLASANAAGKQGIMILYSANPCSYCQLFIQQSLSDPDIAAMVQKHYGAIGLEIFNDASLVTPQGQETTVKDFAKHEGVMFSPTVLFYDNQGNRVFRITGYQAKERFKTSLQYVIGKHYRGQSIAEYVQKANMESKASSKDQHRQVALATLKPDSLFSEPPHLLQRNVISASEPLLVIFEAKQCEECKVFHDKVLSVKAVRKLLEKYQVVQLDADDEKTTVIRPDGSRATPSAWYKQEGFSRTPAMLFFTENGQVAIKTDNLLLKQRMLNSINYVIERAYLKGWSYQRFARSKAIERNLKNAALSK